jgi:hypothetical protein
MQTQACQNAVHIQVDFRVGLDDDVARAIDGNRRTELVGRPDRLQAAFVGPQRGVIATLLVIQIADAQAAPSGRGQRAAAARLDGFEHAMGPNHGVRLAGLGRDGGAHRHIRVAHAVHARAVAGEQRETPMFIGEGGIVARTAVMGISDDSTGAVDADGL